MFLLSGKGFFPVFFLPQKLELWRQIVVFFYFSLSCGPSCSFVFMLQFLLVCAYHTIVIAYATSCLQVSKTSRTEVWWVQVAYRSEIFGTEVLVGNSNPKDYGLLSASMLLLIHIFTIIHAIVIIDTYSVLVYREVLLLSSMLMRKPFAYFYYHSCFFCCLCFLYAIQHG
jgi:hypothetical protein